MNLNLNSQSIIVVGAPSIDLLRKDYRVSDQDFFLLDSDYTMAHLKELLHFINLKPYNSEKKLAIIQNFENLSAGTANVLLKTLEEPPEYMTIILTTQNEQKILPTISSRCAKIRLGFKAEISESNLKEINFLSPDELKKISVAKRFKWAASVSEEGNVEKIIILWQEFYREKMLQGENVISILTKLSRARDLLQTNISVKLLLESLTLSF